MLEEVNSNQEDLCKREIYWIKYYDAINSKDYYNIGAGGIGCNNSMNFRKGKDSPMFGKHHTNKTKEKISKLAKDRYKNNIELRNNVSNRFKGKHLSEEHKRKISENHADTSGGNNGNAKKCILIHNNYTKEFNCIKDLQNYLVKEYNLKLSGKLLFKLLNSQKPYIPRCVKHKNAKGFVIKRI